MKNKISQALMFASLLTFFSCNSDNKPNQETASATQTTETVQQPEQQSEPTPTEVVSKPTEYFVGDTLDEGRWKFCVTRYEEGKTYNAAFYPKEGDKYVTLECLIINTTEDKLSYSLFGWTLGDEEGYEYTLEMLGDRRPSFDTGELPAGKKHKGFVTFECPKSAKNFEFHFNPEGLSLEGSSSTYTIKLHK